MAESSQFIFGDPRAPRPPHYLDNVILTPAVVQEKVNSYQSILLEIGAGNSPVAMRFASVHPNSLYISQDIQNPYPPHIEKWMKQNGLPESPPENFVYAVGDAEQLPLAQVDAIVSILPAVHPDIAEWLSSFIAKALEANPRMYIEILTETKDFSVHRENFYYLGGGIKEACKKLGLSPVSHEISYDEFQSIFGNTDTSKYVGNKNADMEVIEINPKNREMVGLL